MRIVTELKKSKSMATAKIIWKLFKKEILVLLGITTLLIILFSIGKFESIFISLYVVLLKYAKGIYSKFRVYRKKVEVNAGPKVFLWIIDGCNIAAFLKAAQRSRNLKRLIDEGYFARSTTIFPSITPAAHSSIITGCYQKDHGIPAFDWVDLTPKMDEQSKRFSVGRDYIRVMPDRDVLLKEKEIVEDVLGKGKGDQKEIESKIQKQARDNFFSQLADAININMKFLNPLVNTIFESVGSDKHTVSMKEYIHRGADDFVKASVREAIDDLVYYRKIEKGQMDEVLNSISREFLTDLYLGQKGVSLSKTLGDLMVYWKISTDSFSHKCGPYCERVEQEIIEAVDKLAETIVHYKKHTNEELYVIITSDHSQTPVYHYVNLQKKMEKELKGIEVAGRLANSDAEKLDGADVIFANNDRAGLFYLFESERFSKNDLRMKLVEFLKDEECIDLIFYKYRSDIFWIRPQSGSEPQRLDTLENSEFSSEYPNAVERVRGLMEHENSGDVSVSLKEGYSFNESLKYFEEQCGKPMAGEKLLLGGDHGGLNYKDSICPLLIWGPKVRPNKEDKAALFEVDILGESHDELLEKTKGLPIHKSVDIAPIISRILEINHTPTDGKVPKEIFEKPRQKIE